MGKCGGRELNYVSDVDVIFVAEPVKDEDDETAALATASRLAARLIRVCARTTPEGSICPVDANLRPEGRNGPLVRTLASHLAYYERWAKTWEFQALLKARPVAGDLALGQAYADALGPLVWQAARREHFVEDVQAMRRRVEHPAGQAGRARAQAGPRRAARHRVRRPAAAARARPHRRVAAPPATLAALAALAAGGYVGRADAAELGAAYRFLRRIEHRSSCTGCAAPTSCPRTRPNCAGWAGRCDSMTGRTSRGSSPRSPGSAPTRRPSSTRSGAATPARSGGCTRSCSTGRCSTRWPGCRPRRPG